MPNIERLLVITAPVQELALAIRDIYRWEVPVKTAKYLTLYLVLWYLNLLLSGMVIISDQVEIITQTKAFSVCRHCIFCHKTPLLPSLDRIAAARYQA